MAIRAIKWQANNCLVLFEQAPSMRTIFWSPHRAEEVDEDNTTAFSLPFPWTQFLISFDIGRNLFEKPDKEPGLLSKKMKKDLTLAPKILGADLQNIKFSTHSMVPAFRKNVKLYRPPLPNSYDYGAMCFHRSFKNQPKPSFVEAIELFMQDFYNTVFNLDLELQFDIYKDTKFKQPKKGNKDFFGNFFKQWAGYDLATVVDPELTPFAPVSTEEEHWKNHRIFSHQHSAGDSDSIRDLDFSGLTLNHFDDDGKKNKILLKEHPQGLAAIEALESLDLAVKFLFHRIPRKLTEVEAIGYGAVRRDINQIKNDEKDVLDVLSLTHHSEGLMQAHKQTSRTIERPTTSKTLYNDLGAQPAYKARMYYKSVKEALDVLRREVQTGPLPLAPGLRYWCPSSHVLVFERPPAIKTVAFLNANKDTAANDLSERRTFKIFVPWTQYWVNYNTKLTIQGMYATCSAVPMSNKSWAPGLLPLPNMYYESKVCTPNAIPSAANIGELMLHAYNAVWGSNYNMDLLDGVTLFVETALQQFKYSAKKGEEHLTKLAEKLYNGHSRASLEGFLEAWSLHPSPNDLLRVIPCTPPRNGNAEFEAVDFQCTCMANEDPENYSCECEPPQPKQLPLGMRTMVSATAALGKPGWMKSKSMHLDSSFFSAYDSLLLYVQAHEQKMTY